MNICYPLSNNQQTNIFLINHGTVNLSFKIENCNNSHGDTKKKSKVRKFAKNLFNYLFKKLF